MNKLNQHIKIAQSNLALVCYFSCFGGGHLKRTDKKVSRILSLMAKCGKLSHE